jgi:hypothetical protein
VKCLTHRAKLRGFCHPLFLSSNTGSFVLATIGEIIGFRLVFGFGCGAISAFYTQNFPTRYCAMEGFIEGRPQSLVS